MNQITLQKPTRAFGVEISMLDMESTVNFLFSENHPNRPLVREDMNAFKACLRRKNPEVDRALKEAAIINADGMSIVYAIQFLSGVKAPRVTGCDLFSRLIIESFNRNKKIFLLGATEEIVSSLSKKITEQYSINILAGHRNGYFQKSDWDQIIESIDRSLADFVFIGTPSPQKEEFVNYAKEKLTRRIVLMGVGGSFDVLAGKTKRAPAWMQNAGLEWFYRLIQEPRRMWRRYLTTNSEFVWLALKEKFQQSK